LEPMIEHANAPLEIVDLLQAMVGDCKCEAWHQIAGTEVPTGPCTIAVVARAWICTRPEGFLVCEEYARRYRWRHHPSWVCPYCDTDCWELIPV
jgi:hypothetical protein